MNGYDSMSREELLGAISELRKKLDAAESRLADLTASGMSGPSEVIHAIVNWDVSLSEDSLVLKWVVDRETSCCLAVNDPALAYFERARADFMALRMPDCFPPGVSKGGEGMRPGLLQYRHKSGEAGVLQVCHLDVNYFGRPARLMLANDVSGHRRMEAELRRAEENFRLFAENIREMIWVARPDLSKLYYVNHACSDILGSEERIEYASLDFIRHTRAIIAHAHDGGAIELPRGSNFDARSFAVGVSLSPHGVDGVLD